METERRTCSKLLKTWAQVARQRLQEPRTIYYEGNSSGALTSLASRSGSSFTVVDKEVEPGHIAPPFVIKVMKASRRPSSHSILIGSVPSVEKDAGIARCGNEGVASVAWRLLPTNHVEAGDYGALAALAVVGPLSSEEPRRVRRRQDDTVTVYATRLDHDGLVEGAG